MGEREWRGRWKKKRGAGPPQEIVPCALWFFPFLCVYFPACICFCLFFGSEVEWEMGCVLE